MLTPNERISKLEAEVVELRAAIQIAGALPITTIQTMLDELVDERILPAAVRTEIFGRIRKELPAFRIGSAELARGAESALPHYPTKADREELSQQRSRWRREDEDHRRAKLSLRQQTPDSDQ